MHTRCPACQTIFRVTAEQLRARAGRVRCGRCQEAFNAFDQLVDALPAPPAVPPDAAQATAGDIPQVSADAPDAQEHARTDVELDPPEPSTATGGADPDFSMAVAESERRIETTEETVQAVRAAGLSAARELSETPAYNRWASGVLAGDGGGGLFVAGERPLRWPFVLAALVLVLALAAQLLFHYRVDLVARHPGARPLFAALGIAVGLPRHSALISIESSGLQSDNARGLLVLEADLRNAAPYEQEWPALELTLTDARNPPGPLARRVLHAADYLPPDARPAALPAASSTPVRLWIDAQGVPAAGYLLYVFYP